MTDQELYDKNELWLKIHGYEIAGKDENHCLFKKKIKFPTVEWATEEHWQSYEMSVSLSKKGDATATVSIGSWEFGSSHEKDAALAIACILKDLQFFLSKMIEISRMFASDLKSEGVK